MRSKVLLLLMTFVFMNASLTIAQDASGLSYTFPDKYTYPDPAGSTYEDLATYGQRVGYGTALRMRAKGLILRYTEMANKPEFADKKDALLYKIGVLEGEYAKALIQWDDLKKEDLSTIQKILYSSIIEHGNAEAVLIYKDFVELKNKFPDDVDNIMGSVVPTLKKHADEGNLSAMCALALVNLGMYGEPADLAKSAEYFKKAAANGDTHAMFCMGLMTERGEESMNINKDLKAAEGWFKKAAENGHLKAAKRYEEMAKGIKITNNPTSVKGNYYWRTNADGNRYIVDDNGKTILPASVWDNVWRQNNLIIKKNNKFGAYTWTGKRIAPTIYDRYEGCGAGRLVFSNQTPNGYKYFIISENGAVLASRAFTHSQANSLALWLKDWTKGMFFTSDI